MGGNHALCTSTLHHQGVCRNRVEEVLEWPPLQECPDSLRDGLMLAVNGTRVTGWEFSEQSGHEITERLESTTLGGFDVLDTF